MITLLNDIFIEGQMWWFLLVLIFFATPSFYFIETGKLDG